MQNNLKVYIVACNAEPTCLLTAENKKQAVTMARKQADNDLGVCDDNWTAYEINDYFSTDYEPDFFGWIVNTYTKYQNNLIRE